MHWLEPLTFANGSSLPNRIIPGPMEGVTEGSFVALFSQLHLVDSWFTPFIRISSGVPRRARLKERLEPFMEQGLPVIAQILGTNEAFIAETAARLHALGAVCVDLNCACPSPQVISNHGGGYLLRSPQWLHDTLLEMKKACAPAPISVKIRCGYSSPDEIDEIASAIREAAPDMVTCHFRTVQEMYDTVPNGYERLAKMHELLGDSIPFIGSGDLFSIEDALSMHSIARVDGVAPARGLMKNPLLLVQLKAACAGHPQQHEMSTEEKLAFLNKIGELSGQSRRHQVFILKIARTMFGPDSPEFSRLLKDIIQEPHNNR